MILSCMRAIRSDRLSFLGLTMPPSLFSSSRMFMGNPSICIDSFLFEMTLLLVDTTDLFTKLAWDELFSMENSPRSASFSPARSALEIRP